MCELFAVNAAHPLCVNSYLEEFVSHSHKHKDGWGVCWREAQTMATPPAGTDELPDDPELYLHREPVPAWISGFIPQLLTQPVASAMLEAHIRLSTCGTPSPENCHPFVGTDTSGTTWSLIHNGILFNEELLQTYHLKEVGQTDSERVLLFLLDVLDEAVLRSGGPLGFEERFQALAGAVSTISNLNRLNLIMSDGTYTYVHTNTSEDTLHVRELPGAVVFSTQPLGDATERAQWKPVPRNRLIAYRDGRLVRTSVPHGYVFCEAILELRRIFGEDWQLHVA